MTSSAPLIIPQFQFRGAPRARKLITPLDPQDTARCHANSGQTSDHRREGSGSDHPKRTPRARPGAVNERLKQTREKSVLPACRAFSPLCSPSHRLSSRDFLPCPTTKLKPRRVTYTNPPLPPRISHPTTGIMASFPPPPVNTIDWSNVGFRVREGMASPPPRPPSI